MKERILKCIEEKGITVLSNGEFENMNSMMFVSMIISIENEFDIEIPDEFLLMSSLNNVSAIVEMLNSITSKR